MIIKVSVKSLKVGMVTTNPGLSKNSNPTIFLSDLEVKTDAQLQKIITSSYDDVFIDTEKGSYFSVNPTKKNEIERLCKKFTTTIKEENKLDISASQDFVNHIINNNATINNAMLFLMNLRDFDEYTYTHSINVSLYSTMFGKFLSLSDDNLLQLGLAGLFHDIGKIRISEKIINKHGKLTQAEFEEIKKHPNYSHEIMSRQENISDEILRSVSEHHEQYSGKGYPNGKQGQEISPQALLLSIVDSFDALKSDRCYRSSVHPHRAVSVIFNSKGTTYSPPLVDKFIKFIGIYPIGSIVVLQNKMKGIVISQNNENLLRPIVRVILDENNKYCTPEDIDLLNQKNSNDQCRIVDSLSNKECRIHIKSYMNTRHTTINI